MLFHAGVPVMSGGHVGVDVFFVISGFLITSLLLEDLQADRFSILRFYECRARRILPALFAIFDGIPLSVAGAQSAVEKLVSEVDTRLASSFASPDLLLLRASNLHERRR